MHRPHPIYLYYDSKKWLLILLIPALRATLTNQSAEALIISSLRDAAIAGILLIYSFFKWKQSRYSLHDGLTFQRGLLWQRTLHVMLGDAASVEVERTPLMWLTKSRRIRINTAGLRKRSDATVYLPKSVTEKYNKKISRSRRYASHVLPVVVMSASSSNAAVGLLTLAPAIRQTGQFIGREVSGEVYGLISSLLSLGLPPLLNAVANVLVLGWFFAFLRTFTRTAGFYTEREGDQLHLISGLLTRRDTYIDCSRITTLELRQTLFMRMFRLYTVTITAAGYGREKGARPIIVPAAHPHELCTALDTLLPEYPTCSVDLRPVKKALWTYTWQPLLLTLGSILPLISGGVWTMLAAIWFIAGVWWLCIRLAGFLRAGFGICGGAVTMRYAYGLALYEIHIPREVADCVVISRNPLQKRRGTCTVELRTFGEKRRRHRVIGLSYELAKVLVEKLMNGNS